MNWLLPIVLVLLAGIVFAAGHYAFVRWMARLSERSPPAQASDADRSERGNS